MPPTSLHELNTSYTSRVVISNDTDDSVAFYITTTTHFTFPVHLLAQRMGEHVCTNPPAIHHLTGRLSYKICVM